MYEEKIESTNIMWYTFLKILLLCSVCLLRFEVKGQDRTCDLEVFCISPSDTVINGEALPLQFGRKNLGPDILFSSDTTFYTLFRRIEGHEELVYSGAFAGREGNTLYVGHSSIYKDNYGIRFHFPDNKEPFAMEFCIKLDSRKIDAWGDTVRFNYADMDASNNMCCKQVVVVSSAETDLPKTDQYNPNLILYPNPAEILFYPVGY